MGDADRARVSVVVLDDPGERRTHLMELLADKGLAPIAPRTPLEAIDLLERSSPRICLVAPETPMHEMLGDSFPQLRTADITDDLEDTIDRVITELD
jgi:hypothetical protein